MKRITLSLLFSELFVSHLAIGQVDTTGLPHWAGIVPELVTGGGSKGIVLAVHQRLIYPPIALRCELTGRVFVAFTITPAGHVKQVVVAKSLWAPYDSAAVAAVRQLPLFKPWPQRYGNVRYTVPVSFQIGEDYSVPKKDRRRNSTH